MDMLAYFLGRLVGGGAGTSINYSDIVYNVDGSMSLTDTKGITHTIRGVYEDEKLISIFYDEKEISLTYDGDDLVKIGDTEVDLSNYFNVYETMFEGELEFEETTLFSLPVETTSQWVTFFGTLSNYFFLENQQYKLTIDGEEYLLQTRVEDGLICGGNITMSETGEGFVFLWDEDKSVLYLAIRDKEPGTYQVKVEYINTIPLVYENLSFRDASSLGANGYQVATAPGIYSFEPGDTLVFSLKKGEEVLVDSQEYVVDEGVFDGVSIWYIGNAILVGGTDTGDCFTLGGYELATMVFTNQGEGDYLVEFHKKIEAAEDCSSYKADFQNGYVLGMSNGGVNAIEDTTKIDALENLIDESGVLDDTEGSVSEKIEELIDKAKSGSSPDVDENGIVAFGGNETIDNSGIVSL